MLHWNPVNAEALERLARRVPLDASSRILDVGCGRAELLIRLIEERGARGIGVDPHTEVIDVARAEAGARLARGMLELRCERFDPDRVQGAPFDLAIGLGASHAAGGYVSMLETFRALLRPRGHALVGEGYWRRPPPAGYLDAIDATADEMTTHAGNMERARGGGYEVVESVEATAADWSRYEDTYAANLMAHLAAHPDDPDAPGMRGHIERWRAAYLEWGRHTLGFAVYLLRAE